MFLLFFSAISIFLGSQVVTPVASSTPSATDELAVMTEQGLISGAATRIDEVMAYHGIPYAAPPVGDARWRAPQPPLSWSGVRDGSRFGNRCMQTRPFDDMIWNSEQESENCLYLSVWAPQRKQKLPVMVWIHGGGFASGSGDEERHDGARLASEGVVVVTINYRLGVFGFFAHPDLTEEAGHAGNYGLLDAVAALQWVKSNIGEFGGDPENVTIFGESAGSYAVSALMASPLSSGLFHRAIGQSGAMFETSRQSLDTQQEANAEGFAFAETIGASSIKQLREASAKTLVAASTSQNLEFAPVIDSHLLLESPNTAFANRRHNDMPLLVGWTSAETKWVEMSLDEFLEARARNFPNAAEQAAMMYPAANEVEARQMGIRMNSDFWMAYATWKWAESQRLHGSAPVYRYLFDQVQLDQGAVLLADDPGAAHATDIPFVFDTLDFLGKQVSHADQRTSALMMKAWAQFARTGNPNTAGVPTWSNYDEDSGYSVMRFKAGGAVEPDSDRERMEWLDEILEPRP